jgi:ADP-ribosylglycohydrolase
MIEGLTDAILGSLLLAGMGDALGAPTEAWSQEEIRSRYGGLVDHFETPTEDTFAGANGGARAEVTDDASQMYYLARAIADSDGELDQPAWVACLLDWAATSPKSNFMGPTTKAVVDALREGTDLSRVGVIGNSRRKLPSMGNTNGAAMRVAPTGLVHPGDIESACRLALTTCLPSHDTQVAIASACAIAAGTSVALVASNHSQIVEACREGGAIGETLAKRAARCPPGPRFGSRLATALAIAERASDDASFLAELEAIVGASVLASESVPSAVAIFAYAGGDPMRGISLAASIGDDTDSIATMVGALAGALHGARKLPAALRDEFMSVNEPAYGLTQLAEKLSKKANERTQSV